LSVISGGSYPLSIPSGGRITVNWNPQ
jgi:hypothetical protein